MKIKTFNTYRSKVINVTWKDIVFENEWLFKKISVVVLLVIKQTKVKEFKVRIKISTTNASRYDNYVKSGMNDTHTGINKKEWLPPILLVI